MLLKAYRVKGNSMYPTLKNNQIVLASSILYKFYKPKIKDIVIAKSSKNSRILIKRITIIKGNEYFIEGDNKNMSSDSRNFGPITIDLILGKVILIFP